jgi:hypothetical protein
MALFFTSTTAFSQGTAFTYQGRLNDGLTPASGAYDMVFALYNDGAQGSQVGSAETNSLVNVTNGVFTTTLDFTGAPFNGQSLWLQILVRTNGTGSFAPLLPRQPLTPSPYAIQAANAGSANSVAAGNITGTIANGSLPTSPNFSGTVTAIGFNGNGAGVSNVNALTLGGFRSTNFWQLGGNNVAATQFLGSTNNQAVEVRVGGLRAIRLEPPIDVNHAPNIIEGSTNNAVVAGAGSATIGGGLYNTAGDSGTVGGGYNNTASGVLATVGGGDQNRATNNYASVSGGGFNLAGGFGSAVSAGIQNVASAHYSFVGGGYNNIASGLGAFIGGGGYDGAQFLGNFASGKASTIAGGIFNTANGAYSTVGGGYTNIATGAYATIVGGYNNIGSLSYATVVGGFNNVAGNAAFVGGGVGNIASGRQSFVGGGGFGDFSIGTNLASGDFSTVGGGSGNTASGFGSVVAGGGFDEYGDPGGANIASGDWSVISGGTGNFATNSYATVPGGVFNLAGGRYSFAAGFRARALHDGTFVWGDDSQAVDFTSTAANQFLVRARGGVGIDTTSTIGGSFCVNTNSYLFSHPMYLRGEFGSDHNHGLAYSGAGVTNFAPTVLPDGPVLWGFGGGVLGSMNPTAHSVLAWNNVGVAISSTAETVTSGPALSASGQRQGSFSTPVASLHNNWSGATAAPALRVVNDGNSPDGALSVSTSSTGLIAEFGNAAAFVVTIATNGTVNAVSFNTTSDRDAKKDFAPIDARAVLAKVTQLPLTQWEFKADQGTRHMGPMAQDFHEAFGLNGDDDKHISVVDEGGVALAAIQGLNEKLEVGSRKSEDRIQKLEAENAELKARLEKLERLITSNR